MQLLRAKENAGVSGRRWAEDKVLGGVIFSSLNYRTRIGQSKIKLESDTKNQALRGNKMEQLN